MRAPLRTRGLSDRANRDTHRHTAKVRRELDADAERRRVQRILLILSRPRAHTRALLSATHAKLTDNQRYSGTPVPVNHSASSHPHMAHMATTSADVLTISHDHHPGTHIARDHLHAPRDTFPPTATLARTCSRQPSDVGTRRTWRRRAPTSSPSPTTTTRTRTSRAITRMPHATLSHQPRPSRARISEMEFASITVRTDAHHPPPFSRQTNHHHHHRHYSHHRHRVIQETPRHQEAPRHEKQKNESE